jgi:hypothetical protein
MIVLIRPLVDMDTRLRDIPADWLRYIEHNILRMGEHWYWRGTIDKGRYPMLYHTETRKLLNAKRFIAKLFWDFPDKFYVVNGPERTCCEDACVRPTHIMPIGHHPRWAQRNW